MPKFGKRSRKELATAHPDLQRLFNAVIEKIDCAVICGHRGRDDQNKAFVAGNSKLPWPRSKHNKIPAMAVDVTPWPLKWEDHESFRALSVVVKDTAKALKIKIVAGIDWKTFPDAPHYELVEG